MGKLKQSIYPKQEGRDTDKKEVGQCIIKNKIKFKTKKLPKIPHPKPHPTTKIRIASCGCARLTAWIKDILQYRWGNRPETPALFITVVPVGCMQHNVNKLGTG